MQNSVSGGSGAEVIGTGECRQLLATQQVGRLGVVLDGRPEIFPVNYTVDGDGILFRTADGSKLEGALQGPVVFEADHLQPETRSGWSVVVHGQAERYTRFDSPHRRDQDPSWLESDKPHLVRLTPTRITGRRLRPRPDTPAGGQAPEAFGYLTAAPERSPVRFEGSVANISRDWSMTITPAPPGPPRRIDGYTIGAIPHIEGPGPHGGEVHPDGDEFLYIVSGTMELILDDGDERAAGVETTVRLRSGDAYVVPRGVWHRLEAVEPSYLVHVTPGPNGGHRTQSSAGD